MITETLITGFALGMIAGGWIVAFTFYRMDKPVKEKREKNYSEEFSWLLEVDKRDLNISN